MTLNYTKTVQETKPRLVITHDEYPESPREWCNLGYFITMESRYQSPDGDRNPEIQDIVYKTSLEADSSNDHIELITEAIKEHGEKVLYITPVYRYEHSIVVYRRGTSSGFDNSNCGFYIVTDKTRANVGTTQKVFDKVIDSELETYTSYVNGEVYYLLLYDEEGKLQDSCGGFYDIDDIKRYLPSEFQDEDLSNYLIN